MFYDHQACASAYEEAFSKLTASQYQGIDLILGFMQLDADLADERWAAYMLATVKHECANTFTPITEYGADSYFAKYDPGTTLGARLGTRSPATACVSRGAATCRSAGAPTTCGSARCWA
jgi:hypothetical protein